MPRIAACLIAIGCTVALSTLARAEPADTSSCDEQLEALMPRFLELEPKVFDLDKDKGWRRLHHQGCTAQAARALREYVARRGLPEHVYFHAGQLLASSGDYTNALVMLGKSIMLDEAASAFKWNAYVRAVEAFLRGDLETLRKQREIMATRLDVRGNQVNVGVVDKLIANFGKPYREAVK